MSRFDELKNKAADALGNEEKTDGALDKAANFLREKTGGQHDDKIQKGRDFLDDKLGGEGDGGEEDTPNDDTNRG
ncbi:antitoxin [Ruania zhangjianzhongii]|uniref:antitoxin n=1 Tax=Ruania zhangjianzhongii TaxID=2603206 RepID=UPI0011CA9453|nr:antitoxin [Ruania zhangjianzhongii]